MARCPEYGHDSLIVWSNGSYCPDCNEVAPGYGYNPQALKGEQ